MENIENKLNLLTSKLNKRKNPNILPGQTYRLPSLGKKYSEGVLDSDVKDGEIILYPMTTLDEICLKTPDMLFQGSAVEQVISRRAPQVLKPLELIPKDVDYILSALRQITYGDSIEITYTCQNPDCEHKNTSNNAKISKFLAKAKTLEDFDESKFEFEIDGFIIVSKFSTYRDLISLNQKNINNTMDSPQEIYDVFIDNLAVNIKSIDGVEEFNVIYEFLHEHADAIFQRKILDKIQEINEWGVELKHEYICDKCGHKNLIPIEVNPVSFFSPPSDQTI